MEVVAPATAGELTKVTVSVKNIGGTKGTEEVTLSANGKAVTSKAVTLEPGEQTKITLEHRFSTSEARVLKVGDLPDWPFATYTNNEAYYYQSDGQIIMNAGGDTSKNFGFENGHHSAIYLKDVEGDFVVTAFLVDQEQTNPNALAGLIVRNDIADPTGSAGLALLHIRPKYGGVAYWALDLDGDGWVDSDASILASCGSYPLWFKIEKRGNTFTGYTTNDRNIWYISSHTQKFPAGCDEGVCQMSFADAVQDVGIFANAFNTKNELSRVVFSDFSLVKPVPNESLQFSDLSISPKTVGPRETFTIKATVTNTGSTAGPAKVGLYVNDHEPITQWIELKPGESKAVEFVDNPQHIRDAIGFMEVDPDYIYGSHKMTIGNLPPQTLTVVK
jgi:hypothetical protein